MSRAAPSDTRRFDSKTRRAVADLLRHLAHPNRLRLNSIAAAYLPGGLPHALPEADAEVVRRIRFVIERALGRLTPRQRAIIERCDLAGELHADVIRKLSISAGHFYRERQHALTEIGRELVAGAGRSEPQARLIPDAFVVVLAQASVLEQVGRLDDAIAALERAATHAGDAAQRTAAYCRLAEACASAGRSAAAIGHAAAARFVADSVRDDESARHGLRLDAAAARAVALRYSGEEAEAEALAQSLLVPLRAAVRGRHATSAREAHANVADLLAERAVERGDPNGAIKQCDEALATLQEDNDARRVLRFRLARGRACARVFASPSIAQSMAELEDLGVAALDAGEIVESVMMATSLASAHRLIGEPDKARLTLRPMLDVARHCCSGELRGGVLVELAGASIDAGRSLEAYPLLDELRVDPTTGAWVQAISFLLETQAALQDGAIQRSLVAAHEAIERMTVLRRFRFVGSAMRFQAFALQASGDRLGALASIGQSVEYLNAFGNPRIALRARLDAARLSGDRRRARMLARELGAAQPHSAQERHALPPS